MEIKQGDKVRVSKDAPRMYLRGWAQVFQIREAEVIKVEDDNAVIETFELSLAIPTKYLIKVDAEAKEARFKVGDKVRYIGDIQEHKGEMFVIDGDIFFNDYYKQWQASSIKTTPTGVWGICNVPLSDLEPDTKPTEQTETEKSFDDQLRDVLNGVEHQGFGYPMQTAMINLNLNDWDTYAADLAKELAIAYGKRGKSPLDAVAVAKEITRRLKQK